MSSYPVSRLRLLIYFFCVCCPAPSRMLHRPPVVSKLLLAYSAPSQKPFCACYYVSQHSNGSWSHYTVFKVLRSLPEARLRSPLGDSLAIIPLRATNVKCFFEKSLFFLFFVFFFYLLEFFRSFALLFPVFPLSIYFYIVHDFQFLPYFRRFARCF